MVKTFQYKLYPNAIQVKTLEQWLLVCCRLYNQNLEQRIKAYRRRGVSVNYNDQQGLLTKQRERIESLRLVPLGFQRDALRRVDRGFKAFFRRIEAGKKPGFPRFRSWRRYNSLEYLVPGTYSKGEKIRVPKIGTIRCRGRVLPEGKQKALRILRQPTGWYAQVILDDGRDAPAKRPIESAVGVDVGLSSFATLSDGDKMDNPRWLAQSASKLRALQRRVSRREKGSQRRRKAVSAFGRRHELIGDQRRYFCHQHSTALVRKYDLIAVEKLNVAGMVRSWFGKSILDAAWSTFTAQLATKAECAGRQVVFVNARGTSQECPDCGAVKAKVISERTHRCPCGCVLDRDVAASRVILARALRGNGGDSRVEGSGSGRQLVAVGETRPSEARRLTDARGVR